MKVNIHYIRGQALGIVFEGKEMKYGYYVMLWLANKFTFSPAVQSIFDNLQEEITSTPKEITHHLCENCMSEINIKKDDYTHTTKDGVSKYIHTVCPIQPPPQLENEDGQE